MFSLHKTNYIFKSKSSCFVVVIFSAHLQNKINKQKLH